MKAWRDDNRGRHFHVERYPQALAYARETGGQATFSDLEEEPPEEEEEEDEEPDDEEDDSDFVVDVLDPEDSVFDPESDFVSEVPDSDADVEEPDLDLESDRLSLR